MLIEQRGDVYAATGRPEDALASSRRAFALAPEEYGISVHFRAAFLPAGPSRRGRGQRCFIIGWLQQRGGTIHLDWPRRELRRLDAELAGG